MAILKVSRMGHPVLRRAARAVERAEIRDPRFQKFVDDMIETMHEYNVGGNVARELVFSAREYLSSPEYSPDGKWLA